MAKHESKKRVRKKLKKYSIWFAILGLSLGGQLVSMVLPSSGKNIPGFLLTPPAMAAPSPVIPDVAGNIFADVFHGVGSIFEYRKPDPFQPTIYRHGSLPRPERQVSGPKEAILGSNGVTFVPTGSVRTASGSVLMPEGGVFYPNENVEVLTPNGKVPEATPEKIRELFQQSSTFINGTGPYNHVSYPPAPEVEPLSPGGAKVRDVFRTAGFNQHLLNQVTGDFNKLYNTYSSIPRRNVATTSSNPIFSESSPDISPTRGAPEGARNSENVINPSTLENYPFISPVLKVANSILETEINKQKRGYDEIYKKIQLENTYRLSQVANYKNLYLSAQRSLDKSVHEKEERKVLIKRAVFSGIGGGVLYAANHPEQVVNAYTWFKTNMVSNPQLPTRTATPSNSSTIPSEQSSEIRLLKTFLDLQEAKKTVEREKQIQMFQNIGKNAAFFALFGFFLFSLNQINQSNKIKRELVLEMSRLRQEKI